MHAERKLWILWNLHNNNYIYSKYIYEWICNKLWYNNNMYCILYRSFHHSSTFHHDLQYHVCKAKNFMFSSTFGLHPSSESVSCKEIEAPMIFAFCCAVAKHSDFFWSFVSQSTLCTNLRFQKKPGVGTHLNANLANMHTDTKTKNSKHSNFMVELWAHSCKTCKGSPLLSLCFTLCMLKPWLVPWGHLQGMPLGGTLVLEISRLCKYQHLTPMPWPTHDHWSQPLWRMFFSPGNGRVGPYWLLHLWSRSMSDLRMAEKSWRSWR